jgi:hypothetical protein
MKEFVPGPSLGLERSNLCEIRTNCENHAKKQFHMLLKYLTLDFTN